jgi:RNA polymerase sigma-70 factor, ECF subfamily
VTNENIAYPIHKQVDDLYRSESRRVFATLVRLLGDFDRAEEALHEAFAVAIEQWSRDGLPANPRSWLVSVGRFRAIDNIRRALALVKQEPERRFLEKRLHELG